MEKIDRFIDFIHKKTDEKYSFLRLKDISFSRANNTLHISFIYPTKNDITEQDKGEIISSIRDYIGLELNFDITFTRSYLDSDLIIKKIKEFLDKNHHMFYMQLDKSYVDIAIDDDKVQVNFPLEEPLVDYFTKNKIATALRDYLSRNYTATFEIVSTPLSSQPVKEEMLQERFESARKKSELDVILSASRDKYIVEDKKVIVGGEISFSPRYIKSISKIYNDCVVAGTITSISEKSFTKKMKNRKTGEMEDVVKPFFRFQIKDDTGSINAVIFPSKANYHKMNLLSAGNTVVVEGEIAKYRDAYEMKVKNISLCSVPSKTLYDVFVENGDVSGYRYVSPQPFTASRQAGLFDERHISKEVERGSFVVYDFETTGLDTQNDEIIEIGALKVTGGRFVEVFTTLVKPRRPIPKEATDKNRITNEMVAHSYSIEQVLRDFYLFCQGCTLVGYNSIAFDRLFLNRDARKIGINFDNSELDVYLLAKQKLSGLKNYRLATVCEHLGVSLVGAHRALNDVIGTAEVFLKLY